MALDLSRPPTNTILPRSRDMLLPPPPDISNYGNQKNNAIQPPAAHNKSHIAQPLLLVSNSLYCSAGLHDVLQHLRSNEARGLVSLIQIKTLNACWLFLSHLKDMQGLMHIRIMSVVHANWYYL